METINKLIVFIMSPVGMFIISTALFLISELMALNPRWKSSGIIDFIVKVLQEIKKKQDEKKNTPTV